MSKNTKSDLSEYVLILINWHIDWQGSHSGKFTKKCKSYPLDTELMTEFQNNLKNGHIIAGCKIKISQAKIHLDINRRYFDKTGEIEVMTL